MKRKKLALLLAVALTVTSVDSTAIIASAADFSADPVTEMEGGESETAENPEIEEEIPEISTEEASEDAEIEFSDTEIPEERNSEESGGY